MNDLIRKRDIDYISAPIAPVLKGEKVHYEYVAFRKQIEDISPVSAIPIPEGATNGDVLKRLLYGKAIITEFIHDVNISVNNTVVGQFDMEWWRNPYKRGETDEG